MSNGSLVSAVAITSDLALSTQLYNDGINREDASDLLDRGVMVRDSVLPPGMLEGTKRGVRGFKTGYSPVLRSNGNKRVATFYDIFYNRIHYDPAAMRLGQLLNSQSREITVWSAYFQPRTLISSEGINDEGLDMDVGALPLLFDPLQERTFTLSVATEGPPTIDATYTFTWDNQVNYYRVTGERLVVFAFPPDPSKDFTERLKWYGTINAAFSGKEQRMALSDDPKVSYNYTVQVLDKELQLFDALMWGWQTRMFSVPVWNSYTYTSAAILEGADVLYVESTVGREFFVDGNAIIFAGPEMYEAVEVKEIQADRLILKKPTQRAWTRKVPVLPARNMRAAREIDYTGPVANFREINMSFTAEVGETIPTMAWPTTYKGRPVLNFSPDMSGGIKGSYSRNADWEDGEYSLPLIYDHSGIGTPKQTWQFAWADYVEIQQFKSLLRQLYGTTKTFWISTWAPDLTLVAAIELNSKSMYVDAALQVNMYSERKGRSDIVIQLRDGTVYYRGIVSVAPGSSVVPNSELFTLDVEIPRVVQPGDIRCISYLTESRFENEAFEMVWKAQDYATMSAMIKGLTDGV